MTQNERNIKLFSAASEIFRQEKGTALIIIGVSTVDGKFVVVKDDDLVTNEQLKSILEAVIKHIPEK